MLAEFVAIPWYIWLISAVLALFVAPVTDWVGEKFFYPFLDWLDKRHDKEKGDKQNG